MQCDILAENHKAADTTWLDKFLVDNSVDSSADNMVGMWLADLELVALHCYDSLY